MLPFGHDTVAMTLPAGLLFDFRSEVNRSGLFVWIAVKKFVKTRRLWSSVSIRLSTPRIISLRFQRLRLSKYQYVVWDCDIINEQLEFYYNQAE